MIILALDLATRTGYALGEPGSTPISGSLRFAKPKADHEQVFGEAYRWAKDMVLLNQPEVVAWEAPLTPMHKGGATNANTTKLLYGLPAVIGAAAYRYGVHDIREVGASTVRKFFIGTGRIKRADAKRETIAMCKARGWSPEDDNEADALALWAYVCEMNNHDQH